MTRQPRPRDAFGRPLSPDSGMAVETDPPALPPRACLAAAQDLLDEGRAFRAHEVLEATWKATSGGERDLWRGLAQLAVGVTHAQRGNGRGAAALLRRAMATLEPWQHAAPYDVDVAAVRAWAESAADAAEDPRRLDQVAARASMPRLVRASGG